MKTKEMFMQEREALTSTLPGESIESAATRQSPSVQLSNSITTLRSLDAASIDTLAKAQILEVAEGLKDPTDLFTLACKGKLYFETLCDNLKPYVYAQKLAVKGETYTKNGVVLSPAELGVKYDYKSTQDKEWIALNGAFEMAKKAKEEREKFLKTIKGKVTVVDEETGEVSTIYEPVKSGQSGYKTEIQ